MTAVLATLLQKGDFLYDIALSHTQMRQINTNNRYLLVRSQNLKGKHERLYSYVLNAYVIEAYSWLYWSFCAIFSVAWETYINVCHFSTQERMQDFGGSDCQEKVLTQEPWRFCQRISQNYFIWNWIFYGKVHRLSSPGCQPLSLSCHILYETNQMVSFRFFLLLSVTHFASSKDEKEKRPRSPKTNISHPLTPQGS